MKLLASLATALFVCLAVPDDQHLLDARKGHDRRYSLDITKISEELGYAPAYDFDRGLAETIEWYRLNRAWWEPLKAKA